LNSNLYNIIQNVYLPELFSGSDGNWVGGVSISSYHIPLSSLNFYTSDEVGETLANVLADWVNEGRVVMIYSGMCMYFKYMEIGRWN